MRLAGGLSRFLRSSVKQPKSASACVAKKASALSTDTINAANALKYWLWVARCFVCFQRYASGWSSGAYDGRGFTAIRARWASKLLGGLAQVILCPIRNEKQVRGGLGHTHRQKRLGTFGVGPPLDALRAQASENTQWRQTLYTLCACHLWGPRAGAPALPTCSAASPLGQTGFLCKEDQSVTARPRKIAGHLS